MIPLRIRLAIPNSILYLAAIAVFGCFPLCAAAQFRAPGIAHSLASDLSLQGRVMWIDGSANIDRITTREGVNDIVAHCKKAKFSTIVVDVRPVVGQVL